MIAVPAPTAVTPVVPPVATAILLELQVPPANELFKKPVAPIQAVEEPVIAGGLELTVTVVVEKQPEDVWVNVILAVPAAIPLTTPVDVPTVATDKLPLLQVPAPAASVRVTEPPIHIPKDPVGAGGAAFTVTTAVAKLLLLAA